MNLALNQSSFLVVVVIVIAAALAVVFRLPSGVKPVGILLFVTLLVALAGFASLMRTGNAVLTVASADQAIGAGKPVLMEFYSNL
ncbi:MAG: hypothetical protein O3B84_03085 [Chloroflexi bacterium]|nr:hypothetical protein [Chloroflexota bacterium]